MPARRPPPRPIYVGRQSQIDGHNFIGFTPLRSAHCSPSYHDSQSPITPMTPAVLGTARIWTRSTALMQPQVVDVVETSSSRASPPLSRSERNYSPLSLAQRRGTTLRKDAWVRHKHKQSPLFPFGLRSPTFQCIIAGMILTAALTAFLTLRQTSSVAISLEVTLVILIILSAILLIHGTLRICVRRSRLAALRSTPHKRHHHRQRRRDLEPRYREPLSPFDQLPPDDSLYSPITPVRVHLLNDEEAFLGEKAEDEPETPPALSGLPTPPPPAYGQWRCSVRADPNLLYWERCDDGKVLSSPSLEMVQMARSPDPPRRVPSYRSSRGEELREDDTGMSMEPGVFVEAVADDLQVRSASIAVIETGRILRRSI